MYKKCEDDLKAKEQECEKLKEEVSLLKEINSKSQQMEDANSLEKYYLQQIDQLKAEVDELKRQHQGDKGLITSAGKMNYQLLQEYDKLKAEQEKNWHKTPDEISKANSEYTAKLKQTLTDIVKIAEEQQSWNELNMKHSETESEDDIFAYNWSALKQILQKVREVIPDEN